MSCPPSSAHPLEELPPFRLLLDGGCDGAWNLALDEALLDRCESGDDGFPVLRLYSWSPAALSLGRAQSAAAVRRDNLHALGIDLVRRPTGGTAVLHDHERTYAVVARLRRPPFPGGVVDTYCRIAKALAAALESLGLAAHVVPGGVGQAERTAACFATHSSKEIVVNGAKLVGSAQLRRRGAFLQHGSILLRSDRERVGAALAEAPGAEGQSAGLAELLGGAFAPPELDRALVAAFARSFGADVLPGALSPAERSAAERLRDGKYRTAAWSLEGKGPARDPSEAEPRPLY